MDKRKERILKTLLVNAILSVMLTQHIYAQTPPALKPVRVLIANGKLSSVVDTPLHFKLVQANLPAGQSSSYVGSHGMIYLMSGSLSVEAEGQSKSLQDGEAIFVEAGRNVVLKASSNNPATFLHFFLLSATDINKPLYGKPAAMTELYRMSEPLRGLRPGPYEFTMTRVTSPAKMPAPPMHHRSGAALYYVLSGSGILKTENKAEPKSKGAIQLEPYDFVHSWQNAGETPLVLLQANISPEGTPEIIFFP